MSNTIVQTQRYAKRSQMYLRSSLVCADIAGSRFKNELYPGYTINFPYGTTVAIQNYTYSTDLVIDPTVYTSNTYNIDQIKAATANFDPLQTLTSHELNPQDLVADEMGYQLARNIDQYGLSVAIAAAANTIAGGTLSAANMFNVLTTATSTLARSRARSGTRFIVLDPPRVATLAQTNLANGFQVADAMLNNGYVGPTSAGFQVFMSNDLPYADTFSLPVQPAAGETFTIAGVTWTFVALGTANAPGEISLGANVAATQIIVINALNGTGAQGAATYIDVDLDTRRQLLNMQFLADAFNANVSALTSFGQMYPTETMANAGNVFGIETVSFIAGVIGALDLTIQSEPKVEVRYPVGNVSFNMIATTQFGAGVFFRDANSLVKITANA